MQAGAGAGAMIPDAPSRRPARGSRTTPAEVWGAPLVVKVAPPDAQETARLARGSVLVGFLDPLGDAQGIRALAAAGVTAFAMEAIPRISRAQSMDALSSQSNVAGYRSALLAAEHIGRFFPMLMTAAGTIPPAKVLVLGAGVAGLQALATARRLGAQTTGYDVRPEVAEQVRSLGAGVPRPRHRGGRRGRLCPRALRRGARGAAAGADRRDQGLRRRDHDRARAGAPRADARDRGGGRGHAAGQRDRRPRGRERRQLRADLAGGDDRRPRRHDRLAAEPPRRRCPSTPRRCTRATSRRCSS